MFVSDILVSSQALLKKHELVCADVEAFGSTVKSLEEQSKKCKVMKTLCLGVRNLRAIFSL